MKSDCGLFQTALYTRSDRAYLWSDGFYRTEPELDTPQRNTDFWTPPPFRVCPTCEGTGLSIGLGSKCPQCEGGKSIPIYYTPEQWEAETGREVPGDIGKMSFINEYPKYVITDKGRVFRVSDDGNLKEKAQQYDRRGYKKVHLYDGDRHNNWFVHSLVAKAFIRYPSVNEQVNHKDGNKENNTVSNLGWLTCKENIKHAHDKGLRTSTYWKGKKGYNHSCSKEVIALVNGKEIARYGSCEEASRDTGLCASSISKVARGKLNRTGGIVWKYATEAGRPPKDWRPV